MKKIIKIAVLLLVSLNLLAVFDDYEPSPRARAMGGTFYSTSDDANGIFYNPAGLSLAENNLAVGYTKLFGNDFQVLNTVAFTMELPKNFGKLGLGLLSMDVDYLDVNLMSEKIYALAHSITLLQDVHSSIYLGYVANFYHLSINSFGDQTAFGLNLGALAILHQRTRLGFAISNLNNPKIGEDNLHNLPRKIGIGISYLPYEGVSTSLELKKTLGDRVKSETEIHAGTEIEVLKSLVLRFGVRNKPSSYSMGAKFELFDVYIDYAYNTHILDATHHFGIGYKF